MTNHMNKTIWLNFYVINFRPDTSVGTATRYVLDGPSIKSRGRDGDKIFRTRPDRSCGAYPASNTMCAGTFPGLKRPGRGVDHPYPSSATVKETVELYSVSHSLLNPAFF